MAMAHFNAGVVEGDLGESDQAIRSYRLALANDVTLSDASLNLTVLLVERKRFPEAMQVLQEGVRYAPEDERLQKIQAWFVQNGMTQRL